MQYLLRAATPGVYHALPTRVEPMYEPDADARGSDDLLTIRP